MSFSTNIDGVTLTCSLNAQTETVDITASVLGVQIGELTGNDDGNGNITGVLPSACARSRFRLLFSSSSIPDPLPLPIQLTPTSLASTSVRSPSTTALAFKRSRRDNAQRCTRDLVGGVGACRGGAG